jgi:hypothetical protein
MVHVEIAPAQPIALAHVAEKRMLRDDGARIGNEFVIEGAEAGDIRGEFRGPRAADELVDVRACGSAMRPLQGHAERQKFHQSARQGSFDQGQRKFAEDAAERIGEMADHLMSVHAAPKARRIGSDAREALADFALVGCGGQSFHARIVARIHSEGLLAQADKMERGEAL